MMMARRGVIHNFTRLRRKIIDFGINPSWDLDKKRMYRQVNAFSLTLAMISFSALPIAFAFKLYSGLLVQVMAFLLYLLVFHFVIKGRINAARSLAIYTFETQMFIVSIFAILPTTSGLMPWYSPVFISYMLYPIIAALFDKSIFKHMLFALGQMVLLQFIGNIFLSDTAPLIPENYHDVLNLIICFYTICMSSLIIYILYSENYSVKNKEIERSLRLKEQVDEVSERKEIFKKEASDLKIMNESKNKLFSILAHDLKSPFNVMLGFSSLLKDMSVNDPEYHKYAKQLYETSLVNYNLLENMLEWSKSQLDYSTFEPEKLKVNEVVIENLEVISLNAKRKGISVINKIDDTLIVNADKSLLSIVFRNILTNAVKFTYPGGSIIIDSKIKDSFVEISIKDNGIGMPEEMVRTLFVVEKMQSRKGTESEKGTGLGLIICKEFIEKNGGRLWVRSEETKGTEFIFTLPLSEIAVTTV